MRRVYLECLVLLSCQSHVCSLKNFSIPTGVPRGSRLQASHIGTVAELCLRITSDVLVVFCFLEKQLMLFRGALVTQRNLSTLVTELRQSGVRLPRTC